MLMNYKYLEVVMSKSRYHRGIGLGWGLRKNTVTYSWCPGLDLNLLPHKYKSSVTAVAVCLDMCLLMKHQSFGL